MSIMTTYRRYKCSTDKQVIKSVGQLGLKRDCGDGGRVVDRDSICKG